MGIGRKQALIRMMGTRKRLEEHLRKMADNPNEREIIHWKKEARIWLNDIEDLLRHIGKKTRWEWKQWIEQCRKQIG